eukprot:scaffold488_cov372-Prasinococcus_capsulatus_cf.AAC.5
MQQEERATLAEHKHPCEGLRARYWQCNTLGLPPRRISVPRPAMLVAMVTAPGRPARAIVLASCSTISGLAFRRALRTPKAWRKRCMRSESSTDEVPTSTGRLVLLATSTSRTTPSHLACCEP